MARDTTEIDVIARRFGNRWTAASASEAHQRQLTAPVHKWRKAWVAPTGLQPESSYKICKWVKIESTAGETPGDEDDEDDMDDGEDGNDENDNDNENEDENEDAEDGAGGAPTIKVINTDAQTAPTPGEAGTTQLAPDGSKAVAPAGLTPAATSPAETPAPKSPAGEGPTPQADTTISGAAAASTATDETHGIPAEIPGNAIEMTNTAPGHVEDGSTVGMDFVQGHSHVDAEAQAGAQDKVPAGAEGEAEAGADAMDVDVPGRLAEADGAEAAEPEKGVAPAEDAGLTMGEMEPAEAPELAMPKQSEDQPMEME